MNTEYLSLAIVNLKKRKLRSFLTILGILIAIAIIVLLISIALGLEAAVQEQFRQLGTDKFFIQPKGQLAGPGTSGAVELTLEDVDVIEKVSGVKEVAYITIGNAEIKYGKQTRYVLVGGVDPDKISLFTETGFIKPEEGKLLESNDLSRIMIGSQYKYNNFFNKPVEVGDTISINGQEFRAKAILESVGNPQDDRFIYLHIDSFKQLFPEIGNRIDQIAVQTEEGENVNEIANRVEKRLKNFRNVDDKTIDFTILTPEELLETFGTILNLLTGFLLGIAAISLLVGGIGIANTMYTSVLERTREIGVMKAVGARNKDIVYIFTLESGLLGLIGGTAGIILGMSIAKAIEYIAVTQLATTLLKAVFPPYLIIGCLIFSFVIGTLAGMLPAWRAANIKPVEALRYE